MRQRDTILEFIFLLVICLIGCGGKLGVGETFVSKGHDSYIRNLHITRSTGQSIEIGWDSNLSQCEIDYRRVGEKKWKTIYNVFAWENPYNVIGLKPETEYEFQVLQPSYKQSPKVGVKKAEKYHPPIIDGNLNDSLWRKAAILKNFKLLTGEDFASIQTKAYLTYDSDNLYIGVECLEPNIKGLVVNCTEHDSAIWQDDSIEIFLDTNLDRNSYYQFIVNTIGVKFDTKRDIEKQIVDNLWNPDWKVKTEVKDDSWIAEISIPFKELGLSTPKEGEIWGLNLVRTRQAADIGVITSQWSCTYGASNHAPKKFGNVVFGQDTDFQYEGEVGMPLPRSATVRAHTTKSEYKTFNGLRLYPTEHIRAPLASYPCIETYDGFFWIIDSTSLSLVKVDPETKKVLWKRKKPLAFWPLSTQHGYIGLGDSEIFGGKLWLTYSVQDSRNPKGYKISQAQSIQYLLSYDFTTNSVSTPIPIPPTKSGHGVIFAGLKNWRGKLWVMQRDEWIENGVRRSLLALRTYEDDKFGEPIVYENIPTPSCWGPSINIFNDKIVLMFSDVVPEFEQGKSQETLYYTLFDGKRFSKARIIQEVGQSRYAKGIQIGKRFVCVYKCSAPYYKKYGYMYHDLACSIFTPGTDNKVKTIMYVDDRKYNSSPDIIIYNGRAIVVHNKLEHLYTLSENPAVNYGVFIGEIVPEDSIKKMKK